MSIPSLALDAFFACAQESSFTKAAKLLSITQSALSQRISKLEDELETTLFLRERSGVQLTEEGLTLLRYCQTRNALEEDLLKELKSGAQGELSGQIKIAGFSSAMRSKILPRLAPLLQKNPSIKLNFSSRELDQLPLMLKTGEADFILTDVIQQRDDLFQHSLYIEENVLVQKKGYKGPTIYLDHDEKDQTTTKYLKLLKKETHSIQKIYLDDIYGIIDGVRMGLGCAVVPIHLIKGDKKIEVLNPSISLDVDVILSYYKKPYYSQVQKAVIAQLGQ